MSDDDGSPTGLVPRRGGRRDLDDRGPMGSDGRPVWEVLDGFERFSQVDDVFNRASWDPAVATDEARRFFASYREPLRSWRKASGFGQRDYAIRNAAWQVVDVFAEMHDGDDLRDGFLSPLTQLRDGPDERFDLGSPEEAAATVKQVARTFGADLVGLCAHDERWVYTERYARRADEGRPVGLPEGMTSVVVVGQAMDRDLVDTVPSALSGAATGLGYSKDALVLLATAQWLRNLGYRAVPSLNDTALAIPLAIRAGLGEYGRHGMVITPEYGPRVRFGKIFTDLPVSYDRPVELGVTRFCESCRRCTNACPPGAIPDAGPVAVKLNRSSIGGVRKWSVDGEKCFSYWAQIANDCMICMRVCPYNKDFSRLRHQIGRRLAATRLRGLMLWLEDRIGYGKRLRPRDWWAGGDDRPA
ncbi:MAG: reductive dehalogenase [Actinomycetota bacterium]|nr:reductive dehalogenase [Actinomycetota bacterium]MEC9395053.1 reductive dehalogenase [Actinomycetota bacterium]